MGRISFWDAFLSDQISWREREAINSTQDQTDSNSYSIDFLQGQLRAMGQEVVVLRALVTVLVNTLRDTNTLDPSLLDARIEAALEEVSPQPKIIAGERTLVCTRCMQAVPAASTTMTAQGAICDRACR